MGAFERLIDFDGGAEIISGDDQMVQCAVPRRCFRN